MDEAPRTQAVSAPLPDELRPYIVLHAENATLPAGSRFGGHWVSAWRSRLPFVQIDRARSHEVGRCVPFASDGDADQMAALLGEAACLIAADETWLDVAATAGTPTIYLADGHPDRVPLPDALASFSPERLRVLRSGTNFRRDLPLRLINEAMEQFVPGVTGEDRSESSLCRDRLAPYMRGRIADLGHGGHKIHKDAIGVDFFKFDEFDWIGDVRDLWFFDSNSFDSVYSSHCLEDLWHPHQALDEWTRILRPGGHLSLFLPLRDFYPNVGTEGANPGHKDDYVPEDVEQFLRELGHVDIVHSERIERENSFEVVARKRASRSFFLMRDQRPKPSVSVLIVADPSEDPTADAQAICAAVASAQAALGDAEHEVLVLDRTRSDGDARAAVRDLAASDARVCVIEDRRPLPYGQRWELLRRAATGDSLLVLQPGVMLAPGAGDALRGALAGGAEVAVPTAIDPLGRTLATDEAARTCLLIASEAWPCDALQEGAYTTDRLWQQFAEQRRATPVTTARAIAIGERGRPIAARGRARIVFDEQLRRAGIDPMRTAAARSILVVMLRTFGDCVLSTPVLSALRHRHPDARIEVLTERPYAWIFAQHESVDAVRIADCADCEPLFLAEDRIVTTALEQGDFDRLVFLSDRHEHVSYHHSGLTLSDFYAVQAGVPEACGRPPKLAIPAKELSSWQQRRAQLGLDDPYAVVHTRAGWAEKSPTPELVERIAAELARAGLTPVVIGGPNERIEHPGAINLAGDLSPAESAAVIAGAALFVGPDSGPLHIASAFGIKSLALYGGSHLRVAPPRAHGSCSVQAASCCPVPCGVSPCPERHCGAAGLSIDAVLQHLHAVIEGRVGDEREFWGERPALCAASADGPTLVGSAEQIAAGIPSPPPEPATRPGPVRSREVPAPIEELPLELGMFALEQHARLLRTFQPPVGTHPDTALVLEALRDAVAPELGLAVLRTLLAHCQSLDHGSAALQIAAASIAHCGAMMRGERGRARPAFKLHARELLQRALFMRLPEPAGSRLLVQLLDVYEQEIGESPQLEHLLAMATNLDADRADPAVLGRLHTDIERAYQVSPTLHAQVLRLAMMLGRVALPERAIALLDQHANALPPAAIAELAYLRFVRGTSLVTTGRLAEALEDMRYAAAALSDEKDRQTAQSIVTRLERHLGQPSAST